jgi:oxygen-dependent protoporphyrinogen oxidase
MPSVAIVGGGIAGLSAAFDLHRAGWAVTVHEAADRWGGKIWSSPVGDRIVDSGPDTFLARVPHGKQLADDLGLLDELVAPVAPVPAYFHRNGELCPLPAGTVLGVPTDLEALTASGAVSSDGVARAAKDLSLPVTDLTDHRGVELSVGAYCRARLGDEVTERLIDPLVGGINASDIDRLSLRSGAPQLWQAANRNRSIIEGLREMRASVGATLGSAAADEPVFLSHPDGIARMVEALVDRLDEADLRLASPIDDLADLEADHVIIAAPAPVAASLVGSRSPEAAVALSTIEYASVAQVTVELPVDGVDPVLDASGILFPRVDGKIITASTWFSTKWAHHARAGRVLIRLTSGRFGDTRALELDDAALVTRLLDDLGSVIEITAEPTAVRVHRWLDAFPQYTPGHAGRVELIEAAIADDLPEVQLVGAAYRGIGIPACIADGRTAAANLLG